MGKGVDGNELERTHLNYLRHILGVGKNIAGDILRYEAACPPYMFMLYPGHGRGKETGVDFGPCICALLGVSGLLLLLLLLLLPMQH